MNFALDLLRPWQWGLLLAVPPAIVLLYFLKLKRETQHAQQTVWERRQRYKAFGKMARTVQKAKEQKKH